jgi:Ca2+/Na+ antiporter
MSEFISGALFFGFIVVALFFLRFWRKTGDRLFALLALSFALMALSRFLLGFVQLAENVYPYAYMLRLLANLLIIYGIIDKNRSAERESGAELSSHR